MKCQFCSAPLPKKGLICDYCGKRNPLNLKALSKIEIEEKKAVHNCPVCNTIFDNINIGAKQRVIVQRCNDCDGVFITEDILEQLVKREGIEEGKIDFHILRFVQNNPRQKTETVIRYKKCPICEKTMQRINYRAISGVIVDRCLRHGIWLDGGELRQLFEWKQAGGVKKKNKNQPEKEKTKIGYLYGEEYDKKFSFDPLGNFFNWVQGG